MYYYNRNSNTDQDPSHSIELVPGDIHLKGQSCQRYLAMSATDFQPSELGTKEHWDDVYSKELTNFKEIGDEGEIWFGEDSIEKMVDWVVDNLPSQSNPSILEVGSGNGSLLFALHEAGYDPTTMLGIDYSEDAVKLSTVIGKARGVEGAHKIAFAVCDFLQADPVHPGYTGGEKQTWNLVLDKGTLDAIALAEKDHRGHAPSESYPSRISAVLKPGGYFLIYSCNFTEEELRSLFANAGTDLTYHSRIKFPSFSFGGQSGTKYASVAFRKNKIN